MSFRGVVVKTWNENQLFSVLVELTYRCNWDCYFCYNDLSLRGTPLSKEQYVELFEELAHMQVMNLVLSGGEPLAHPDFLELGAKARDLGFVVRIKTNAHALRGRLAERVREEIDPFLVEVSLHGASAQTHDRQTRVAGSFDRLLANLEEAKRLGLRIKINSTLTRWNEAEVRGMFEVADRLELPIQFDPEVSPRDDGDRSPLDISPSSSGLRHLLAVERERAERHQETEREKAVREVARQDSELMAGGGSDQHCGAGSSGLAIDPFGNVYPCVQWRRAIGNLHDRKLGELWRGNPRLDEVRRLSRAAKDTVREAGENGWAMAFCPGAAETHTGSPLEIYDAARRRMELVGESIERESTRALPVLES